MPDHTRYAELLESEISFRTGIGIALFFLLVIWTVCILTGWIRTADKKDKIMYLVVLVSFFALVFGVLGYDIRQHRMDIDEQAYVVYEGEFTCRQARVGRSNYGAKIYLTVDGEELDLTVKSTELDYGAYIGRVVYSERTEKLLEFQIYETKNQEE